MLGGGSKAGRAPRALREGAAGTEQDRARPRLGHRGSFEGEVKGRVSGI